MDHTILLNEFNPIRHKLLRSQLEGQGYRVRSASHLGEGLPILRDVAIDLMILDADRHKIDELVEFAGRWKGALTLLQKKCPELNRDFRNWMECKLICKRENGENVVQAASDLLRERELRKIIVAS